MPFGEFGAIEKGEGSKYMKVLLLVPYTTMYPGDNSIPTKTCLLGVGYIASSLEKQGHSVRVIDAYPDSRYMHTLANGAIRYGMPDEEIIASIREYCPDIIGISCMYTAYAIDAHHIANLCKDAFKDIPIVMGGSHVSQFPDLVMHDLKVDIAVIGEGEETIAEIINSFEKGIYPLNVSGTIIRNNGKIVTNPTRQFIKNLDSLPFPAWHLFNMDAIIKTSKESKFFMRQPALPILTSRGCPGKCYFCQARLIWKKWRMRSPTNVADEIEYLMNKYGAREIHLMDDNASASRKRFHDISDEIIKRKLDIKWTCLSGIPHWSLDEELLDKMKEAGCYRLTFGIESGDPETRKVISKSYPLEQAKSVIKHANYIGMWTMSTFIVGFPHETQKNINTTIDFACSSGLDMAVFYAFMPLPGTEAYRIMKEDSLVAYDKYLDPSMFYSEEALGVIARAYHQGTTTRQFSSDQILQFISSAYTKFFICSMVAFLNPLRLLRKIRSFEDLRYAAKIGSSLAQMLFRRIRFKQFNMQMLRWDKKNEKK